MKVEVFTSANCPACVKVKKYLASKGYAIEERSLLQVKNQKFLTSLGISSVPVVKIGSKVVVGADMRKIDSLLREFGK
jgi:glutaredoxin